MTWLLRAFIAALALGLVLPIAGLLGNRPPLTDPPGLWTRLHVYFTRHEAETRPDHPFPELRPPHYGMPPAALHQAVRRAVTALGWEIAAVDDANMRVRAVVTTPLWRFKDDVEIRVDPEGTGSRLYARSRSRVGRGDLAANSRHLRELFQQLAEPRE